MRKWQVADNEERPHLKRTAVGAWVGSLAIADFVAG